MGNIKGRAHAESLYRDRRIFTIDPMANKQLHSFPVANAYFSKPILIDKNTFVVVSSNKKTKCDSIYEYLINEDKWIKYMKYPKNIKLEKHSITYNHPLKILYIHNGNKQQLISLNLNNKKWNINKCPIKTGINSKCIITSDDNIHIIGGNQSKQHIIWNTKTSKIKSGFHINNCYTFNQTISQHELIYIQSINIILLFGGWDSNKKECFDKICEYKIGKNEWITYSHSMRMPKKIRNFSVVSIKFNNSNYIFFLGGLDDNNNFIDSIYVYHFENKIFVKSSIKSPIWGHSKAVVTNNSYYSMLLIYGYIRSNCILAPNNLKDKIVEIYGIDEYIYVLSCESGAHWRLSVQSIIDDTSLYCL